MVGWYRYITNKKKVPLFCLMLFFIIILASCQSSEPKIEELTKEFLIGTWVLVDMEEYEDFSYLRYTEDGDVTVADSQSNLDVSPTWIGKYTLEGSNLTNEFDDNSPTCAGGFFKMQVEITQSGDLYFTFDDTSYECPEGKTKMVPFTYSRVSD